MKRIILKKFISLCLIIPCFLLFTGCNLDNSKLESKITEISQEYQTEIDDMKENISDLQSRVDKLESEKDLLKTRVTELESQLEELKNGNVEPTQDDNDSEPDENQQYTITFDYNCDIFNEYVDINEYFDNYKESQIIDKDHDIDLPTLTVNSGVGQIDGWYIKDTDIKVENNDDINEDMNLVARWNILPNTAYLLDNIADIPENFYTVFPYINSIRVKSGKMYNGVYYASEDEDTGVNQALNAEKGGTIYIGSGNYYTMSGGMIKQHNVTFGGAIYVASGGTLTITGGTITDCQADYGLAIYVESGGTCILTGGTIDVEISESNAAIYLESGALFRNTGCNIVLEHSEQE